jgi:hypothetical protein
MVENDYPVPSYLADVFSKPDGWIETPEADADAKPEVQLVYAIDCEMVRAIRAYAVSYTDKDKMSPVHHSRRQGADSILHHRLCNEQGRI